MAIVPTPVNPYIRRRGSPEMKIQAECVKIAWNEFPETRNLLFHVENESGGVDAATGARRKAEGIVRGVSDLILMLPRGGYHALCIEMKTETGYQSSYQKNWEKLVSAHGYRYEVIRSAEDFRALLTDYLGKK